MALQTQVQTFEAERLVGARIAQVLVRAEALVPGAGRDAIEPLLADAGLFIGEVDVQADRVVLEGSVACQAVYRQGEEIALRALTAQTTLSHVLDIPGVQPGMLCRARGEVSHVDARYENGHMVFQAACDLTVQVLSLSPVEVISAVDGVEGIQTVFTPIRSVKLAAEASELALLRDTVALPAALDGRTALMDWVAVEVDEVLRNHEAIMDLYDPERKIDLLLDEWGTWFRVEPGTNPGHLFQQSSMRDAMVAAMSLNIFHKHTARLKMTNIAQMVNVLQAMILTKGSEIVLTPTYHVFRMFNVHQDAISVPVDVPDDSQVSPSGRIYPELSVSASKSDAIHVSLANPSVTKPKTVELEFDALKPSSVTGEILVGKGKGIEAVKSHNDFGGKTEVAPAAFKDFKTSGKTVKVTLPPASVVVLEIK